MKKLFTVAVSALLCTGAFAQTSKGTIVLSGSLGVGKSSRDYSNNNTSPTKYLSNYLNIEPGIGYFLNDNLEAGAYLGFGIQNNKTSQDGDFSDFKSDSRTNTYSFTPYVKKYFPLTEKIALSTRVAAGIRISKSETENSTDHTLSSESESKGYYAAITPGITFFPTEKIGISTSFGSLGYSKSTVSGNGNGKSTSEDFGLDLNGNTFMVGFSYHFNR